MEPMGIFFLLAVAVMAAGFALRGPVSRRMGTRQDGGVTSTQIAALTIPFTMTVLLVGAWVSVFLVPDDATGGGVADVHLAFEGSDTSQRVYVQLQ